ncbi:MAG: hypothetical protein EON52_19250 [Actinomycetales bacterium]|nr:MAG: hypothetical protein EON52_19250 [Actinomycetales bacterium]
MAHGALVVDRQRPTRGTVLERAIDRATLAQMLDAVVTARTVLDDVGIPSVEDITDFASAHRALRSVWTECGDFLRGSAEPEHGEGRGGQVIDLRSRVVDAERVLHDAELRHHERSLGIAHEALSLLREASTTAELLEIGTSAVCQMGFDRAFVSHVEGRSWIPDHFHVNGDPEWAAEMLRVGRAQPQHLFPGLPEHDMMRRRRPVLVTDVQDREHVNRPIADASQSRSYVAAPLQPGPEVIGFFHADRYFHRGSVSEFDQGLLHLFAEGFAYALERTLLLQRLDSIRRDLTTLSSPGPHDLSTAPTTSDGTPFDRPFAVGGRAAVADQASLPADERLTRREMDVLRLLAAGETNARIARRLVVAESTVKSHVKSILRKLGAANRAEALVPAGDGLGG